MKKKTTIIVAAVVVLLILILGIVVLQGGGDSYEKQLVGTWYAEPGKVRIEGPTFVLNKDGTGNLAEVRGIWYVDDENRLTFTDSSGTNINIFMESGGMQIIDLEDGRLVLASRDRSMQLALYDTPQE